MTTATASRTFHVEIIKPSHYDDDGYVIQWMRAFIPSNSLGCLYALAADAQQRQVLGADVEIDVRAYDETHTVIPVEKIKRRMRAANSGGIVLLAGVQSNQFPRAVDLARHFIRAGIPVAIGGFHVSGCLSMLPEIPADIQEALDLGITIFAGEGEDGRIAALIQDAYHGRLRPIYNFLNDLPELQGQITPFLPPEVAEGSFKFTAFDVGRGCPFRCSFCTIINVQGRKSRFRDADDVEHIVRTYARKGVNRFFMTDDNMARNKNWEPIFDRLIQLRENEGFKIKLFIQVDTMCHKIPGFIEKAARAGCNRVFIGMESVNPENLAAAKKYQNNIDEYRKMLQAWRNHGVLTHAGFIVGFPADTPDSVRRDIQLIQRELPIDILEFFVLTPLPGSADHQSLQAQGTWMDPDMNIYDSEHVTTGHPRMTTDQWKQTYHDAWHQYYTPEHIETLIRRAHVGGCGSQKMLDAVMVYFGSFRHEGIHPLQCGILRRKVRTSRRSTLPLENPLVFYPRRIWETMHTLLRAGIYYLGLQAIRRRVLADPLAATRFDPALVPAVAADPLPQQGSCESGCDADHEHHSHDQPKIIPLSSLRPAAGANEADRIERAA